MRQASEHKKRTKYTTHMKELTDQHFVRLMRSVGNNSHIGSETVSSGKVLGGTVPSIDRSIATALVKVKDEAADSLSEPECVSSNSSINLGDCEEQSTTSSQIREYRFKQFFRELYNEHLNNGEMGSVLVGTGSGRSPPINKS